MPDQALLLINTAIAIIGIVVVITRFKMPPVFALLLGTLYLGLTTKLGPSGTPQAIVDGFADVMGDIGILVTFGVVLGALLTVTDTMQRLVDAMLRRFGDRSIPYVFAGTLSALFTSIYSDVLLVLSAPLARRLGPKLGPKGLALMGGSLTAGIEVGLVFVAPGVAAVAIAGILGVPLGEMFLFGLAVGLPTTLLTMLAYAGLLRVMSWNPELDELAPTVAVAVGEDEDAADRGPARTGGDGPPAGLTAPTAPVPSSSDDGTVKAMERPTAVGDLSGGLRTRRELPLLVAISPVLLTLALIAGGALLGAMSVDVAMLTFLTDPVVAIFLGASLAFVLAGRVRSSREIDSSIGKALAQCGPILVLSGISGSLGFVIEGSGMADILSRAFNSGLLPPLLLVWLVAAVLHVALGSISVAGITAAGILAPIAGSLDTPLVLVALAAGSGALFLPHVSSNFFWMFQSLLGLSTRGTVKTHTIPMTLASIISLPLILLVSVFV